MSSAAAIKFIESLAVPTGPLSGRPVRLAPYQKRFLRGALARGVNVGVLSVARGGGKSTLTAGVALGHLIGAIDPQPRRECLVGARTRDQGRIVWDYVAGLARSLPEEVQKGLIWRRAPRLEIEYDDGTGPHLIRVLAADGRNALGTSPTLVICDERGAWDRDKGDDLENALLSGCGKRGGRMLLISTSAADDAHPFSAWLDQEQPGVYRQEHRADDGCPPDDLAQIRKANPGATAGVEADLSWLQAQARRAIARGGSQLVAWRRFNLNQRVAGEDRDVLLTVDQWLSCETAELPAREGPCIMGVDLGGSASMSASVSFWPSSGRLEAFGAFPSEPSLLDRGQADAVSGRYVEMRERGELITLGGKVVPASGLMAEAMRRVAGETVTVVCDRYRQAEMQEACAAASVRAAVVWRGQGYKDGGEDVERFRQAVFDGRVRSAPSLLMRSAMADAVCLKDPAANWKLAKGRSHGRIDAAAAAVLAVAEGARMQARPRSRARIAWG
jgi:phage terminase large subunit-like protein